MQQSYPLAKIASPVEILRKAGYSYFRDPQSGEESFVIRLTPEFYPRFHLYVESTHDTVIFNLHLDQKKPSYGEHTQHSGEYDGPVVEKEMERLHGWVRALSNTPRQQVPVEKDGDTNITTQPRQQAHTLKRLWKKIFGRSPGAGLDQK